MKKKELSLCAVRGITMVKHPTKPFASISTGIHRVHRHEALYENDYGPGAEAWWMIDPPLAFGTVALIL